MTKIINLYGGPGTGKSLTAASIFVDCKRKGINTELVSEYVKQWAWQGRKPINYDQFYFFGQQSRREYTLFDQVDVIVTDSPVALCGFFTSIFGSTSQSLCFRQMVHEYYSMLNETGVECHHIFLERTKAYDPRGRFQTEEEAISMDLEQILYLKSLGFNIASVKADENASSNILEHVGVE